MINELSTSTTPRIPRAESIICCEYLVNCSKSGPLRLYWRSALDLPPPEIAVQIALRVPAFAMAPSGAFRLCTWAAPEEANLSDLLAHGNNVFTASLPGVKYDAQGHLNASDYSQLDPILGRLRAKDVVLLLQGIPSLHGPADSAAYRDDLKKFLGELVAHLAPCA